jgi:hypothetical protein
MTLSISLNGKVKQSRQTIIVKLSLPCIFISIAIISLIFQLNTHVKLNICIFLPNISYMFRRSAPSSGRTLIASQTHLLIVSLLQCLRYRARNILYVGCFTELFTSTTKIMSRSCGLKVLLKHKKILAQSMLTLDGTEQLFLFHSVVAIYVLCSVPTLGSVG